MLCATNMLGWINSSICLEKTDSLGFGSLEFNWRAVMRRGNDGRPGEGITEGAEGKSGSCKQNLPTF